MKSYDDLCLLFEEANKKLLTVDKKLFDRDVSEPGMCGALMIHLHDLMQKDGEYVGYYTDLEYNRNIGYPDHQKKVIIQRNGKTRRIKCDLIIHSRGEKICQDNLLAVEMKKTYRSKIDKQADRDRLMALTSDWYNGKARPHTSLPEYVCGYVLGIYYELDLPHHRCWIEYFYGGQSVKIYEISLFDNLPKLLDRLPWQEEK